MTGQHPPVPGYDYLPVRWRFLDVKVRVFAPAAVER
jgi:hypothetical protein